MRESTPSLRTNLTAQSKAPLYTYNMQERRKRNNREKEVWEHAQVSSISNRCGPCLQADLDRVKGKGTELPGCTPHRASHQRFP